MKKKTYKLIENISESIMNAFPYLTAKEHSEVMENFIYNSLKKNLNESKSDNDDIMKKAEFLRDMERMRDRNNFKGYSKDYRKEIRDKRNSWKNNQRDRAVNKLINGKDYYHNGDIGREIDTDFAEPDFFSKDYDHVNAYSYFGKGKDKSKDKSTPLNIEAPKNKTQEPNYQVIAAIAALAGTTIPGAILLYKKYGDSIVKKLMKSTEPSMMEKAKTRFKNLMKKIRLAESVLKSKKKKIVNEGFMDDVDKIRAVKSLGGTKTGTPDKEAWSWNRMISKMNRRNRANDGLDPWDDQQQNYLKTLDPEYAKMTSYQTNDAGREIDNEFEEPDFFDPKYMKLGKPIAYKKKSKW